MPAVIQQTNKTLTRHKALPNYPLLVALTGLVWFGLVCLTRHNVPMYGIKGRGDRAVKHEEWPIFSFGPSVTMISATDASARI